MWRFKTIYLQENELLDQSIVTMLRIIIREGNYKQQV